MAQKTFVDGDVLTASDLNTYCGGEGGAWTTYTPTVAQGASTDISKTVTYSKYARYGRTIHFVYTLAMTASGSSGSIITISLPVTAASASGVVGTGNYNDAGSITACTLIGSTTSVVFMVDTDPAGFGGDSGGSYPQTLTVGSGDILKGSITYEAAS